MFLFGKQTNIFLQHFSVYLLSKQFAKKIVKEQIQAGDILSAGKSLDNFVSSQNVVKTLNLLLVHIFVVVNLKISI